MTPPVESPMTIGIAGPVSLDLLHYPDGLPDTPEGYPAPVVSHFVNALLRRGHRVVVFTTSPGPGLEEPMVFDQGQLVVCVAPRYRARSALTFFGRERRWLRSLMDQYPVDLVHAMWSYEFALAALQSGRPTIVHYHDHARTILRQRRDAYRFLRWILSAYVTGRAKHKVANSEYLKRAFGRSGRHMVVIPNFLPVSAIAQREDSAKRLSQVVVVSNGFAGRKNVPLALEAFRLLRRRQPAAELVLIGDEMGADESAGLYAREHGLDAGVSCRGQRPYAETVGTIRESAALLSPSLEESFGMTILEAMAVGTPVVAGQSSGNVPELLADDCGLLCQVTDALSIADALESVMSERERTTRWVSRAYHRYETLYSEGAVLDRLEELYRRVSSTSLSSGGASE